MNLSLLVQAWREKDARLVVNVAELGGQPTIYGECADALEAALAKQAQPEDSMREAMIEVLESTPYNSIEFKPGMRYTPDVILAAMRDRKQAQPEMNYERQLLRNASALIYFRLTGAGNEDAQRLVSEIDRITKQPAEMSMRKQVEALRITSNYRKEKR